MRNAFIAELTDLASDLKVFALLADNGIIVFDRYAEKYPKQLLNVGIAEANYVAVASGMASCGFIPFVYTITPFLVMRAYEFIRNDVCEQNKNVKIVGIGAGFAYSTLGPTHHATEDISVMRCLPNITIFSPADPLETRKVARAAYEITGPVYIRIGTGRNPVVYEADYNFIPGKGVVLKKGSEVVIFSTGSILKDVLDAAHELEERGISTEVCNIHTIKPLDAELVKQKARTHKHIFCVEEHTVIGGLGSAIAEVLAESGISKLSFTRMGLPGVFAQGYGTVFDLRERHGISKDCIVKKVQKVAQ